MNQQLLLDAAALLDIKALGRWSNVSYEYDTAAYILALTERPVDQLVASGRTGPFFDQAKSAAQMPNDKLLWVGGWPKPLREAADILWGMFEEREEREQALAELAAEAVRDYVNTGGWA